MELLMVLSLSRGQRDSLEEGKCVILVCEGKNVL